MLVDEAVSFEKSPGEILVRGECRWIGFAGNACPEELWGSRVWKALLANGSVRTFFVTSAENSAFWAMGRSDPFRIVGYWYTGAENHPSRNKSLVASTISFGGQTWTLCEPHKMPEELNMVKAGDWEYLLAHPLDKDLPYRRHSPGKWASFAGYWDKRNAPIVAYRILSKPEAEPEPEADQPKPATFERAGYKWTSWHGGKGVPKRLKGVKANDWWRINSKGEIKKLTSVPDWKVYWRRGDEYEVHAFSIPAEDAITGFAEKKAKKSASEGELRQSPSEIKYQAEEAELKNNAGMINRDGPELTADEKRAQLIDALVGNGNIFAPPKRTTHPLFRVTPITVTGRVMWGADHQEG